MRRFITFLKALCAWQYVGRSGCWHYWQNSVTGARTAKWAGGQFGSEALHRFWLTGGDWDWDHYPLVDAMGNLITRPPLDANSSDDEVISRLMASELGRLRYLENR